MRFLLFLFILGSLTVCTAAGVAVAVYFFHVDSAPWTQVNSWKSPPVLVGAGLFVVSLIGTVVLSALFKVVAGMLASQPKPKPKPARAQSNRRTTI